MAYKGKRWHKQECKSEEGKCVEVMEYGYGIWIWNIEGVDVWLGMKRERGGERTRDYVNQVTGYGGQGDRGDRGTGDGRQQTADGGRGN